MMVDLLNQRTQTTTIHKVRVHANITSNEAADALAKSGREKDHHNAILLHEFAHSTPYFFQKIDWPSMEEVPDKGPIRSLKKYIIKHDLETNLKTLTEKFPNLDKWVDNALIDNKFSNTFWTNPTITDAQKTCLLKFRTGLYKGNARKQLFFGIQRFPSCTCSICNSTDIDTWLHVLLKCKHHHIHALRTKRHNKAV